MPRPLGLDKLRCIDVSQRGVGDDVIGIDMRGCGYRGPNLAVISRRRSRRYHAPTATSALSRWGSSGRGAPRPEPSPARPNSSAISGAIAALAPSLRSAQAPCP